MTRVEPQSEMHPPGWEPNLLSIEELQDSGLLFEINRRVLWPLGLSLAIRRSHRCARHHKDTCPQSHAKTYGVEIVTLGLFSSVFDHDEVIIPSGGDVEPERAAAFVKWSAERLRRLNR